MLRRLGEILGFLLPATHRKALQGELKMVQERIAKTDKVVAQLRAELADAIALEQALVIERNLLLKKLG